MERLREIIKEVEALALERNLDLETDIGGFVEQAELHAERGRMTDGTMGDFIKAAVCLVCAARRKQDY